MQLSRPPDPASSPPPQRLAVGLLALLAALLPLAACPRPAPPEGPVPAPNAAAPGAWALSVPGLVDVACEASRCLLLTRAGLADLATRAPLPGLPVRAWEGLRVDGGALRVSWTDPAAGGRLSAPLTLDPPTLGEATPDPLPAPGEWDVDASVAAQVERLRALETRVTEAGWRRPFTHLALTGGSPVAFLRASGGTAQLMRAGSPPATARFTTPEATASWPAPFALPPGGKELYVLPWPSGTLLAVDPLTLATRWTAPLGAAAHGLFLSPDGRWLVAAVGPGTTDRLVDWPLPALDPASPHDPLADEALRALDRPRAESVAVVDLAARRAFPAVPGQHRRWLTLGAAAVPTEARAAVGVSDPAVPWQLLATDRGVAIFPTLPLPTPAPPSPE